MAAFILPHAVVQERHVFDAECCCALRLPQSGSTMSQTRQLQNASQRLELTIRLRVRLYVQQPWPV